MLPNPADYWCDIILEKTTKGPDGKDRLQNGNYILTVGQHFVIIVGEKGSETAMISMSSSQGKVSRKWNSMMTADRVAVALKTARVKIYLVFRGVARDRVRVRRRRGPSRGVHHKTKHSVTSRIFV